MEKIKLVTLNRALTMLDAIGARYAIISPDGTRFGDLPLAEEKTGYNFAELGAYVKQQFTHVEVGDVLIIPVDKFDVDKLQSAITSHACKIAGKGSYTTCRSKDKTQIEILRLA
jgi:hypothetical protein